VGECATPLTSTLCGCGHTAWVDIRARLDWVGGRQGNGAARHGTPLTPDALGPSVRGRLSAWEGGRGTTQHGTARHSHRTPWSPRSFTAILRCDLQSSRSVSAACPDPQLRFHVCSNGVSPTDVASTVTATGSAACDPAAAPTPAATTPRHHNNIAETQNVASCCTILNFNLAKMMVPN
jgi:hypothetical protein